MHEHDLQQLGLSEKEAKVYLAVLELGQVTVIQIAQKAEINRPTAYVQIKNLMQLGLMSSHEKGKKTYFAAEPPERLLELIRKKQTETDAQSKRLKEILPELQTFFDTVEERPKVRFYEGKEGIMAMADDIFKVKNKEILTVYPFDLYSQIFSTNERENFEAIRRNRKISSKALYTRKAGPFATPPPPTIEDRFIPHDTFPISAGVDIYENKIAAYALRGKLVGVIVESQEISDTMRSIFHIAWEGIKLLAQENK